MARKENLLNNQLKRFEELVLAGTDLVIEELWDAPKALLITLALQATKKNIVIISGASESRIFDDFPYFAGQSPLEFPAWEALPRRTFPRAPISLGSGTAFCG